VNKTIVDFQFWVIANWRLQILNGGLNAPGKRGRQVKAHLWLIRFIGIIVPQRLRAAWRQAWEAELLARELLLEEWEN
jgi:hypothetical protein